MNILFLSLIKFTSFEECNIYTDLLRELIRMGHTVQAVCPSERRYKEKTNIKKFGNNSILTIKTYNIQKTNIIEKGIGTLAIKKQFIKAIKKHLNEQKFDLILYPTPPITLCGVVEYFKKRDNAKTYLMLKDIFPQNAVDLGIIKTTGLNGIIYKHFRKQEKRLYAVSDKIGCMSPANVQYLLKHNSEVGTKKVEVFPNCIEPKPICLREDEKNVIKQKYGLPLDKMIFIYGGNLGKPQDVSFIIKCLENEKDNEKAFFLIVGDGTEYQKLNKYASLSKQTNFRLLKSIPRDDFKCLVSSCDVGLVFLDNRFTIPNFPSRILTYLEADLPVLALTDSNTDLKDFILSGQFGWWLPSNKASNFSLLVKEAMEKRPLKSSKAFLLDNYTVTKNIKCILDFSQNID